MLRLPQQTTPFIGRNEELHELAVLLAKPDCRLLTLAGPGGCGKTRLAIEAARLTAQYYADGVYFVTLQPVNAVDLVAPAIAEALNFTLRGREDPRSQLLDYLRDKRLLLVLDNFEHLLAAADFLPDILAAAPQVKLLVTSREIASLREEWLYPVGGLRYPRDGDKALVESYSAVQLFLDNVRRIRRDFSLEDERVHVTRIVQAVEGMPLAIELAASWLKLLPCETIAAEIQRNINILETGLRNVPERHRSMRAVSDQSWQFLSEAEREVFARLAVFRGGFQREAAEQVARATLERLSALVDKSILKIQPDGRYQMHELLRQYAEEHLAQSTGGIAQAQAAHRVYYSHFLHARLNQLMGGRQLEAIAEIRGELDNIRAAWQSAVDSLDLDAILRSAHALGRFYLMQGRFLEGAKTFEEIVQRLSNVEKGEKTELALVSTLMHFAHFNDRMGRWYEVRGMLAQCQELYHHLGIPPLPFPYSDPRLMLSPIYRIQGNYPEAVRLAEEALSTSELYDHPWNRALAYYALSWAALVQGQHDTGRRYAQHAYMISQTIGDQWFLGYCINALANIALEQGDFDTAEQQFRAFYELRKAFDDEEGMARALKNLGEVALGRQRYAEAYDLNAESLAIYRRIHEQPNPSWRSTIWGMSLSRWEISVRRQATCSRH